MAIQITIIGRTAPGHVDMVNAENFDANLSYNFVYNFRFNLGYRRTFFKWRDYGGDYVYSDAGFRDTVGNFGGGTGIMYEQSMNIPYIGLEYEQPLFNKKLWINLSGAYSNQVKADGYDYHILRETEFVDEFRGGTYYNLGAKIQYMVRRDLSLGFGYEYNEVKEIIGNTTIKDRTSGATSTCENCAGLSNKYEKFSIFLKYFFNIPEDLFGEDYSIFN
jgi:outer membrane protease